MKKKVCCICGKEITGWGNNPWGAIDEQGNTIQWMPEDECCEECNAKYVIPGRIVKASHADVDSKTIAARLGSSCVKRR